MQLGIRFGSAILAGLAVAFLLGSMFGPDIVSAQNKSSKKSDKKGASVVLPTAFDVQAADPSVVDLGGVDPETGLIVVFSHSRTPVVVSDPTTGEPIDDLVERNFTLDQIGGLQACGLDAPPPFLPGDAFEPTPFSLAVRNFGNGLYSVDVVPGEGCVAGGDIGLQISVRDGIRQGRTAGRGFANGPYCLGPTGSFDPRGTF